MNSRLITEKVSDGRYVVRYGNGKACGSLLCGDDGFWFFDSDGPLDLTTSMCAELYGILSSMNDEWEKQIESYFSGL